LGHLEALAGNFSAPSPGIAKHSTQQNPILKNAFIWARFFYRQGKLREAEMILRELTSGWNESIGEACHLLGEVLASQRRYVKRWTRFSERLRRHPHSGSMRDGQVN